MSQKRGKPVMAWGGFVGGKLGWREVDDRWGCAYDTERNWVMAPAVFWGRKGARDQYQDVRRVEIREARVKRARSKP